MTIRGRIHELAREVRDALNRARMREVWVGSDEMDAAARELAGLGAATLGDLALLENRLETIEERLQALEARFSEEQGTGT